MHAENLADDRVKVWEGVQLIHRRPICLDREQLFAELLLDILSLSEGEQAKCSGITCGLVTCYEEPAMDR